MEHITIRISGTVQGQLWWPYGAEFERDASIRYSLDDAPFSKKWESVGSALEDLRDTVSGDSSSLGEVLFATLEIERISDNVRNVRTIRTYDLAVEN